MVLFDFSVAGRCFSANRIFGLRIYWITLDVGVIGRLEASRAGICSGTNWTEYHNFCREWVTDHPYICSKSQFENNSKNCLYMLRFNLCRIERALLLRHLGLHKWSLEYYRLHFQFVLRDLDWFANNRLVFGAGKQQNIYILLIRNDIEIIRVLCLTAAWTMGWEKSMVSARAMGPVRSHALVRRCFCRRNDIFIPKIGSYILHKSASRTVAGVTRPNDYWYYQIFLHLHAGLVCIWMR